MTLPTSDIACKTAACAAAAQLGNLGKTPCASCGGGRTGGPVAGEDVGLAAERARAAPQHLKLFPLAPLGHVLQRSIAGGCTG